MEVQQWLNLFIEFIDIPQKVLRAHEMTTETLKFLITLWFNEFMVKKISG